MIATVNNVDVQIKDDPLPHHVAGRQYTRTGYRSRIPTRYKVFYAGKWRRVYAACWSNMPTYYIGHLTRDRLIVRTY